MSAVSDLKLSYEEMAAGIIYDPDNKNVSELMNLLNPAAEVLGTVLEQTNIFLDGTCKLIIELVGYAVRIIREWKFPKKIRIAAQAINHIGNRLAAVIRIPRAFADIINSIISAFQSVLNFLGGFSINLGTLARDVFDTTFFGDTVFATLLNVTISPPAKTPAVDPNMSPSPTEIISPYLQLIVSAVLAAFTFIKKLLEALRPVWDFVKSLMNISPVGFISAIMRLPSILVQVLGFIRSVITAFSNFPSSMITLLMPIVQSLLDPVIVASSGLRSGDDGNNVLRLLNGIVEVITNFFRDGVNSVKNTINRIIIPDVNVPDVTFPSLGVIVPITVFILCSIMGAVRVLLNPLINIIGAGLAFEGNTLVTTPENPDLVPSFTGGQVFDMSFYRNWLVKTAWTNELGMYTRQQRKDILFEEFTIPTNFELINQTEAA